ncbi:MAG: protein phosphatase 2C domain-containing protein [Phaeospirillum sp.]|nr:protein phosphatase 2C domain-containing protein [Phaeospirillum sp.]
MAVLENSQALGGTGRPGGNAGEWFCHVCRNGLAVVRGRRLAPHTPVSSGDASILLLGGEPEDTTVAEPPLGLVLTDQEVGWIRATGAGAIAATWYGPEEQAKSSNQDFALSARLRDNAGKECVFAAVADGVTTKTFWAARTARLACLAALRVTAAALADGGVRSDTDLARLRGALAQSLRSAMNQDRLVLAAARTMPEGWSPEIYSRNMENGAYWYNSTLLLSLLGDSGGFVMFAGDGGIHVAKRAGGVFAAPVRPLKTDAGLEISSFVSLSVTEADFRAARLSDIQSLDCVEVVLATDGVDRTLQVGGGFDDYDTLNLSSPTSALAELKRLGMAPKREVDNYSIARLTWPPSAAPMGARRGGITLPLPEKKVETSKLEHPRSLSEGTQPTNHPQQFSDHGRRPWPIGVATGSFLGGVALTLAAMVGVATWIGQPMPWTPPLSSVSTGASAAVENKAAADKATADKAAADKAMVDKAAADKATADKAAETSLTACSAPPEEQRADMQAQAKAQNSDRADVDLSFLYQSGSTPLKLHHKLGGGAVEFCAVTNAKFEPSSKRKLVGHVSYQVGKPDFTYDMTSACDGGPSVCNDYFVVATKDVDGKTKLHRVAIRYKSH